MCVCVCIVYISSLLPMPGSSGWPVFERCCAELVKRYFLTDCRWTLMLDLGNGPPPTLEECLHSERCAICIHNMYMYM